MRREHVKINKQKINIHYHHNYKQTKNVLLFVSFPLLFDFHTGLFFGMNSGTDTGKVELLKSFAYRWVWYAISFRSIKGWADTSICSLAWFFIASQAVTLHMFDEGEEKPIDHRPQIHFVGNSFISDWLSAFLELNWFPKNVHTLAEHQTQRTRLCGSDWLSPDETSISKDVNNSLLGIIHGHKSIRMCALYWFEFLLVLYVCVCAALSFSACGSKVTWMNRHIFATIHSPYKSRYMPMT